MFSSWTISQTGLFRKGQWYQPRSCWTVGVHRDVKSSDMTWPSHVRLNNLEDRLLKTLKIGINKEVWVCSHPTDGISNRSAGYDIPCYWCNWRISYGMNSSDGINMQRYSECLQHLTAIGAIMTYNNQQPSSGIWRGWSWPTFMSLIGDVFLFLVGMW